MWIVKNGTNIICNNNSFMNNQFIIIRFKKYNKKYNLDKYHLVNKKQNPLYWFMDSLNFKCKSFHYNCAAETKMLWGAISITSD